MVPHYVTLLFLLCTSISAHQHEHDPSIISTMEQFSGYSIHEPTSLSSLSVDAQGLQNQIDQLSGFSDAPAPAVTRVLYTHKDVLARRYVKNLMGIAGLSVREDAVGNIFGRWDGSEPELAAVATGSHIDAIPYSGKYDGVVGVLGAIEAINVLKRNDAGLAAAELALAVEQHVLESGSIDTVGTVGILELHPGAINSIPSKSHIEIDTRDIDEERRNQVINKIHETAIRITKTRGVKLSEFHIINQDPPAPSDKAVINAMETATKELNLTSKLMISRAYHDSLFMARVSPMGMIFIPCYKGYSHKPEEFSSIEDMSNGVKVLAFTLAKLSLQ